MNNEEYTKIEEEIRLKEIVFNRKQRLNLITKYIKGMKISKDIEDKILAEVETAVNEGKFDNTEIFLNYDIFVEKIKNIILRNIK